jgi:hypothetical protein
MGKLDSALFAPSSKRWAKSVALAMQSARSRASSDLVEARDSRAMQANSANAAWCSGNRAIALCNGAFGARNTRSVSTRLPMAAMGVCEVLAREGMGGPF